MSAARSTSGVVIWRHICEERDEEQLQDGFSELACLQVRSKNARSFGGIPRL